MSSGQAKCAEDEEDYFSTIKRLNIPKEYLEPCYESYNTALQAYARWKGIKDLNKYDPKTLGLIKKGDPWHYWYWTEEAINKLSGILKKEQEVIANSISRGCADAD